MPQIVQSRSGDVPVALETPGVEYTDYWRIENSSAIVVADNGEIGPNGADGSNLCEMNH